MFRWREKKAGNPIFGTILHDSIGQGSRLTRARTYSQEITFICDRDFVNALQQTQQVGEQPRLSPTMGYVSFSPLPVSLQLSILIKAKKKKPNKG